MDWRKFFRWKDRGIDNPILNREDVAYTRSKSGDLILLVKGRMVKVEASNDFGIYDITNLMDVHSITFEYEDVNEAKEWFLHDFEILATEEHRNRIKFYDLEFAKPAYNLFSGRLYITGAYLKRLLLEYPLI